MPTFSLLQREAIMDLADVHAYWQHPSFPGKSWDRSQWQIANTSLVNAWAKGKNGTLDRMTMLRPADKPFTVSEYDHGAPSEYAAECVPLLAATAALQDWDAIYNFQYGPWTTPQERSRISDFFDCGSHPAKIAFYPAAVMLFRQDLLPAIQQTSTLQLAPKPFKQYDLPRQAWLNAGQDMFPMALLGTRKKMAFDSLETSQQPLIKCNSQSASEQQTLDLQKVSGGGYLTIQSDMASMMVGQIGGKFVQAGEMSIDCQLFEKNFGALVLTAMDQKPIIHSTSMLLTVIGQARNQNMGWNDARNSIGQQWGDGPTEVLGIPAVVMIHTDQSLNVYALDAVGQRRHKIETVHKNSALTFNISSQHQSVWYELASE